MDKFKLIPCSFYILIGICSTDADAMAAGTFLKDTVPRTIAYAPQAIDLAALSETAMELRMLAEKVKTLRP